MNFPNIEAERARLGYSKVEFAEKLGVETKTYYNWIKGVNPIPSDKLILLSKICNASIDYLLGIKKRAL
ncbi:helix-turn-helix domain-containing protein [Amedibacterium intestinale]|uniref:helix-turn-helix domain-containing protein n=1 Tax=Amedibacterium intestinale TaxID=2583452 RepID=UPI000E53FE74|nr:helix-turn-helix transcriptional regulator [Amedibacterium intestinale]RHO23826.1 XRE family transcriptional regulator [Eubacterium sp. AM18-26]RHO27920.1 XRE family transcriptional regulator [Eubacterium sp. AM18-10LB-B]